jgi:glucose-1-phosphate cytidylyltransferase
MKVVILCGGLGTRLREETEFRPKPLVEVGGRPILWHIMKLYAHYGHREFVCCLGYRGHMIKEYFLDYEAMNHDFTMTLGRSHQIRLHGAHEEQDYQVTLAETGLATQTGGRVKRVERYLGDRSFFVTYGDSVADIDVAALERFHREQGKLATVTTVRPISRYGVLDLEGERVTRFREKPQVDGWVSAGYFVFEPGVLDYLDDDGVLETGALERLAEEGQLAAYRHPGFFHPMDTYRDFQALNELWEQGAPWRVWSSQA